MPATTGLPQYEPPEEPPDGYYRLLYGRHPAHTFAKTQNTPMLSGLYPENELWLAASEAARLGLSTGDRVMLKKPGRGRERTDPDQGDRKPSGRTPCSWCMATGTSRRA